MNKDQENLNPIEYLTDDTSLHFLSYLENSQLTNAMSLSKGWQGFICGKLLWRTKLVKEFNVTADFIELLDKKGDEKLFLTCYKSLDFAAKNKTLGFQPLNQFNIVDSAIRGEIDQELFIDCLLDDVNLLKKISVQSYDLWFVIATQTGCTKIPKEIMKIMPIEQDIFHSVVIPSGNKEVVEECLTFPSLKKLTTHNSFEKAVQSGKLEVLKLVTNNIIEEIEGKISSDDSLQEIKIAKYIESQISNVEDKKWEVVELTKYFKSYKMTKYLLEEVKLEFDISLFNAGVLANNPVVIQYLMKLLNENKLTPNKRTFECAALTGNLSLFKKLQLSSGFTPKQEILNIVTASKNVAFLMYLIKEFKLNPEEGALSQAAWGGDLEMVEFLWEFFENKTSEDPKRLFRSAVSSGNVELVKFLLPKIKVDHNDDKYIEEAIYSGNNDLVYYLLKQNFKRGQMLYTSLMSGNLALVELILDPINKFEIKYTDDEIQLFLKDAKKEFSILTERYLLSQFDLPVDFITQKNALQCSEHELSKARLLLSSESLEDIEILKLENHFNKAMNYHPEHFFKSIEIMLMSGSEDCKVKNKIVSVDVIKQSPFPLTQLRLAEAALDYKISLDRDEIIELLTKAKRGFEIMGISGSEKDVAYISEKYMDKKPGR